MAKRQAPRKMLGGYIFHDIINPSDDERAEAFRGKGKLVVLINPQDTKKLIYLTEKQIMFMLREVERGARVGVNEGRTIEEVFNAVQAGILVHPAVNKCPIKPQELYMLIDAMYGEKPMDIRPPA